MKFTKDERAELELMGLSIINPVVAVQDGWQFDIRVEKESTNSFMVDIDVIADENDQDYDLIRANGGRSEIQLTFDEVIDLLKEGYLE